MTFFIFISQKLKDTIEKCLNEAEKLKAKSIAFPAIGTGVLQYPPETVGKVFLEACTDFAEKYPGNVKIIKLAILSDDTSAKAVSLKFF